MEGREGSTRRANERENEMRLSAELTPTEGEKITITNQKKSLPMRDVTFFFEPHPAFKSCIGTAPVLAGTARGWRWLLFFFSYVG